MRRVRVVLEGVVRAESEDEARVTARKAAKRAGIIGATVTETVDQGPVESHALEPRDVEQELDLGRFVGG